MNYERIYHELMESRKNAPIATSDERYYEKHHILPKSMGGSDDSSNIVRLTYREHFLAHKLLFKFTTGKDKIKMGYAWHRISTPNNNTQERRLTSKEYEAVKREVYNHISGDNHPMKGYKHSPEFCEKMRVNQLGQNNSMKKAGKDPWNKGKTKETNEALKNLSTTLKEGYANGKYDMSSRDNSMSDENKARVSKLFSGPKSEAHKKKLSEANKGKKNSPETRGKISKALKGKKQKILKCPHCLKEGGTTMYRWHFDNCKHKDEVKYE